MHTFTNTSEMINDLLSPRYGLKTKSKCFSAKPKFLSWVPRTYMEGKNWLPQLILWSPHICATCDLHRNVHKLSEVRLGPQFPGAPTVVDLWLVEAEAKAGDVGFVGLWVSHRSDGASSEDLFTKFHYLMTIYRNISIKRNCVGICSFCRFKGSSLGTKHKTEHT